MRSLFTNYYLAGGKGGGRVSIMVFSATFNNILAISWKSVLLMEETGVPGENHRHAASHRQIFFL